MNLNVSVSIDANIIKEVQSMYSIDADGPNRIDVGDYSFLSEKQKLQMRMGRILIDELYEQHPNAVAKTNPPESANGTDNDEIEQYLM